MSKRNIIVVIGIVALCLSVVIILYAFSEKPLQYSQNFIRVHQLDTAHETDTLYLGDNSYYIAGVTSSQIFFGNSKDSLGLLVTDLELGTPKHVRLSVDNPGSLRLKGSRIEIDSPFFYIKVGNSRGIFRGTMNRWSAARILDSIVYFYNAISIAKNSFVFQAIGTRKDGASENHIGKISISNLIEIKSNLLEGQVDNYFSTLGTLRYSEKLSQLVYVYHYRNEYLVIDTMLTLLHKATTIDTVSKAHIKPIEIKEGFFTLASPSGVVNMNAEVYDDKLFVHSNLMASNETKEVFDRVSVIDVYDLKTSMYQFSFYLPHRLMIDFKVEENRIIAIHGQYVISYSFNGFTRTAEATIN